MKTENKGIENLTKTQATLYRSYVATNSKGRNQQKEITRLCELGKEGHKEIVAIAELLKANAESTATIKVQVSRAMAKLKTGLTLQGLGKKDEEVFIGLKNTDNVPEDKPEVATKPVKPEDTVEPNTKKYDIEDLEDVFFNMARDTQGVELFCLIKGSKFTAKVKKALTEVLQANQVIELSKNSPSNTK